MRNIILLLFIISLTNCSLPKKTDLKPIIEGKPVLMVDIFSTIDEYKLEEIRLSEFVDSVKFIKLETKDECLIDYINKVYFIEAGILIIDRQQGIMLFDNNGGFIRKIGNRGRGPGEYLKITASTYDYKKQLLIIYGDTARKLLVYNLAGDCIKEIPFETEREAALRDIAKLPNGNYLCYNDIATSNKNNDSGLWEMDSAGVFVRNLFRYDIAIKSRSSISAKFQQLSDGTISLQDALHNDIYYYKDSKLRRYISYVPNYEVTQPPAAKANGSNIVTAQVKENYIITDWAVNPPLYGTSPGVPPMFSLYDKRRNKNKFTLGFDNSDINAIWDPLMTDTNRDDILLIPLYGGAKSSKEITSEHDKTILGTLTGGMSEGEAKTMNPILEILYMRK
jgi:hypothetical protein